MVFILTCPGTHERREEYHDMISFEAMGRIPHSSIILTVIGWNFCGKGEKKERNLKKKGQRTGAEKNYERKQKKRPKQRRDEMRFHTSCCQFFLVFLFFFLFPCQFQKQLILPAAEWALSWLRNNDFPELGKIFKIPSSLVKADEDTLVLCVLGLMY